MSSSPPAPHPHSPSDPARGQKSGKPESSRHLGAVKGFLILWIVVFGVEHGLGYFFDFDNELMALDRTLTSSLVGLDPFTMAHDFYGRWGDPHSLSVWSLTAPFNVRVHDDRILAQMRALRNIAPTPPPEPVTLGDRLQAGGRALALGDSTIATLPPIPAVDPAAEALANAEHQSECQKFLAKFHDWEEPYHQIALQLTNFNASVYSGEMSRTCAQTSGTLRDLYGPGFYDSSYSAYPKYSTGADGEIHWAYAQEVWQGVLGLPDALLFTVESAFGHGLFQGSMAVFLLILTFAAVVKKWPILIPILPLLAGCFCWLLLELVYGAQFLLHSVLPAPGIPTVASAVLLPVSGLVDSFFSIVKDDIAHKIAKNIEEKLG